MFFCSTCNSCLLTRFFTPLLITNANSYGPPTALDWTPRRRHSLDLEEYEAIRCPESGENPRARHRRHLVISYYKRKEAIQDAGYSKEEIRQATAEKDRAKTRRNMTRQYAGTPMWRVEHAVSSAARKFKKIMSSKKKPTNGPDSAAAAPATTNTFVDIRIGDRENSTHQAKEAVTSSASCGEKDKDSSSAEMSCPKASVPTPQMKKIASASA